MVSQGDLDLPPDGVRPKAGDMELGEANVSRLWEAAAGITDDIAEQARLVALSVIAGVDANELRRRAGIGGIVPVRPPPDERHEVRTHRPPGTRTLR